MKQWYELLFENYARKYDRECFVQGTPGECDFIELEINRDKSTKILDVGCGTGRHAIELAKRGYRVTGIDLSEPQLAWAREKAKAQGVKVNFRRHDARALPFENEFDLAIMLCEGGFPLMETDEMNFEILRNITKALNRNGKFIFTTLNGLFPLFHFADKSETFDLMTFRDFNTTLVEDDSGNEMEIRSNERYYVPSEITWLLQTLGYKKIDIFGAKLGAFSRNDKLTPDDFEMLIVCSI